MRIAVIQATSQISKNGLIVDAVKKYALSSEIFNFGCTKDDENSYSYIEIAVLAFLTLGVLVWIVKGLAGRKPAAKQA